MVKLLIFNSLLLCLIFIGLFVCKKLIKEEKNQNLVLLFSSIITILVHYSSFIYLCFTDGDTAGYLSTNPNLLLPIYPCNVVMWGCLIYGIIRNKNTNVSLFLADYLFWFGIFSTLVGMFANVDFINNPTFKDYEVTKSILAHATLLFNVLLIYIFGYIKIDLIRNMKHIIISVILMYIIGIYCNKIFEVLVSTDEAINVNSMFIITSPFPSLPFLKYPFIAVFALILYFCLFAICEFIKIPSKDRWYNNIKKNKKK
mgnify:CR=1 FL=1